MLPLSLHVNVQYVYFQRTLLTLIKYNINIVDCSTACVNRVSRRITYMTLLRGNYIEYGSNYENNV